MFQFHSNFESVFCKYSGDPDQTLRVAASDFGLHCLPMSHKKDARIIWVNPCVDPESFVRGGKL